LEWKSKFQTEFRRGKNDSMAIPETKDRKSKVVWGRLACRKNAIPGAVPNKGETPFRSAGEQKWGKRGENYCPKVELCKFRIVSA